MREWLSRLRDWFRRDQLDAELEEELRFHREQLEREASGSGAGAEEAVFAARRRLGNVARAQEDARERWSWPWLDQAQQDVRYAVRSLRRTPGFTTAVILTLALGLGANAAMFGVIDVLILRPPAYLRDPATVHRVYLAASDQNQEQRWHVFEYPRYLDLSRGTTSFEQTAALIPATVTIGLGADRREVEAEAVSASFWSFFPVEPVLGRLFGEAEDAVPHGAPVVVVSSAFWKGQLGGRPDVLGTILQVGALRCTIIGVVPDPFMGLNVGRPPAVLFLPVASILATYGEGVDGMVISIPEQYSSYAGNLGGVEMLVRRRAEVSLATANADLTHAFRLSYEKQRAVYGSMPSLALARPRAAVGPLQIDRCAFARNTPCDFYGPQGTVAVWVAALTVLVLIIACANVVNLFFARAAGRRREVAMRQALGIGRWRLARQLLAESLLLASLAAAVGLVVAAWASSILGTLFLPAGATLSVIGDRRTILFAVLVSAITGIVTGLLPALETGRGDIAAILKAGGRGGYPRSRLRSALVVVQAALSVVLLVGAGLFVRSLTNARAVRLGYDIGRVSNAIIHFRGKTLPVDEKAALLRRLQDEAIAIPGVESASRATLQLFGSTGPEPFAIAGVDSAQRPGAFSLRAVSAEHFRTLGTRLIEGRGIAPTDGKGAPKVIVVSAAMAQRLWPGKTPLGQCVRVGGSRAPCATVVGVAENTRQLGVELLADESLDYYLSIDQFDLESMTVTLFVRTSGDAARYTEAIRRRLQPLLPGDSYLGITPLSQYFESKVRQWQLGTTMFVALGGLALVLAAVGLYSVVAYGVAQRTHELGVRVAIGAGTRNILRLVVGEGVLLAAIGVVAGSAIALAAGRSIAPLLFTEGPRDPLVFGVVGGTLMVVATMASLVPALRASRLDPTEALRSD